MWAHDPRSAQDMSTSSEKCTPDHRVHTKVQKPHNAWGEKKLETFFCFIPFMREGKTQIDNRAFRWSNHKKFQKSQNVSSRTSLKERRGREQTAAAAAETSEAVICEIPPRLRLSFHSTLESYIHKPKCIFILYLAYHCIDPPEQNGYETYFWKVCLVACREVCVLWM